MSIQRALTPPSWVWMLNKSQSPSGSINMDYSSLGLSIVTLTITFTVLKYVQQGLNTLAEQHCLKHHK